MIKNDFYTIFVNETSSTMDFAKKLNKNSSASTYIQAVITKKQTVGRGRGGSSWQQANTHSNSDTQDNNITTYQNLIHAIEKEEDFYPLTLIFPHERLKVPIEWVSSLVAASLYDALTSTEMFIKSTFQNLPFAPKKTSHFHIKWPNDIISFQENQNGTGLLSYKKISGILVESSTVKNKIENLYIGIGLNFFTSPNIPEATSFWENLFSQKLEKNSQRKINKWLKTKEYRIATLSHFCKSFTKEIIEYLTVARTYEQLKNLIIDRSIPIGTLMSVNKGSLQGEFLGIDQNSALLLKGISQPIYSGDVFLEEKKTGKTEKLKLVNSTPTLAIDFGNTRIHIGFQDTKEKILHIDVLYELFLSFDKKEIRNYLQPIISELSLRKKEKISIIYTSVNTKEKTNEIMEIIKSFLNSFFPEMTFSTLQITENDIFKKAKIKGTFEKNRIGADRSLKFLFAAQEAKKNNENTLIFSFGTAVTCEGVSRTLEIMENYIFPGIQMALNALHHYTALVPLFIADINNFSPQEKNWNQEIYVQRGVYFSIAASVISTIKYHTPCKCYLTGGNAHQIHDIIKKIHTENDLDIILLPSIETSVLLDNFSSHTPLKTLFLNNELPSQNTTPLPQLINKNTQKKEENLLHKKTINSTKIYNNLVRENFKRIGVRVENIGKDERIDQYMSKKFLFNNRKKWQERILNGEVLVEQNSPKERELNFNPQLKSIKHTYKIKNFDQIWLYHSPDSEPAYIEKVDVLFDDGDLCVFAKPPNMVVHAAGLYINNTFLNMISNMGYKDCSAVHRIDRETSGILICARQSTTRQLIAKAFRDANVEKMYIAITRSKSQVPNEFKVTLPIGVPEKSLIRLKLWINGKNPQPAETWFVKLATFDDYNLFVCLPKTGRTNQIRIHLASIGQWIIGDKMYHENEKVFIEYFEKGFTDWVKEQVLFPRHMLHNTCIMTSTVKESPLATIPIVSELSEDLMASQIVQNLLKKSQIPFQTLEQRKYFANMFLDLKKLETIKLETVPELEIST